VKNYLARQLFASVFYPSLLVITMWLLFLLQSFYDIKVLKLGILPRELKSIHGLITSVFVHGDLGHIASNSLPLLVLGTMLFYFYKKIAKAAFIWMWLISGLWLWIGGRNSDLHPHYHIGASTLVYGLASFLFFSGVFRRHIPLMVVSALVVFLYGSLVWGVLPIQEGVSWEGHLFGALAGLLVAFSYRKEGPQRKVYRWENEEEVGDEVSTMDTSSEPSQTLHIRYIYTKGATSEENAEEEKKQED
jgi:membrane associated rhomboid family serine protease